MINHTYKAKKYLNYAIKSKGRFGVHSPFIYGFVNDVLRDKTLYSDYSIIEKRRKKLMASGIIISQDDFGAGNEGELSFSGTRTISKIIKHSAINLKYGRLLYRMSKYFKPSNILELGTSLGFSTMYLAAGNPDAITHTIEGCKSTAGIARENFKDTGLSNIKIYQGKFDEALPVLLKEAKGNLDLVFIDGNHRYQPTVSYFEQTLPLIGNDGVLILDDIYWSQEMEKAWTHIKKYSEVSVTVDLYRMGIVFFKKELIKQDYIMRF